MGPPPPPPGPAVVDRPLRHHQIRQREEKDSRGPRSLDCARDAPFAIRMQLFFIGCSGASLKFATPLPVRGFWVAVLHWSSAFLTPHEV